MTKSFVSIAVLLLSLSTFISCNTESNSGPCDYTQEKFNMRIIDVSQDKNDESMYIVSVDFDGNISYAEGSHTLSEIRNVKTDLDFIVRNHIENGITYSGTVHTKTSGTGNCEDEIIDWDQKLRK
jgi:hypothetical protein